MGQFEYLDVDTRLLRSIQEAQLQPYLHAYGLNAKSH
jgi:hypothetical protein